jgi:hypothetical protein
MSRTLRCLLAPLALALGSQAGHAQSTLDSACAAAEHRHFDFWVGAWTVTDSAGRVLGTNEITRIAGGCGLREHWRGAQGGEGMSLNVWQPALGQWTQFWVGAGVVLRLTGGLDGKGHMVLEGERQGPSGAARDRLTWEPMPEGAVRQIWEVSQDGGVTWRRIFEGVYRQSGGT